MGEGRVSTCTWRTWLECSHSPQDLGSTDSTLDKAVAGKFFSFVVKYPHVPVRATVYQSPYATVAYPRLSKRIFYHIKKLNSFRFAIVGRLPVAVVGRLCLSVFAVVRFRRTAFCAASMPMRALTPEEMVEWQAAKAMREEKMRAWEEVRKPQMAAEEKLTEKMKEVGRKFDVTEQAPEELEAALLELVEAIDVAKNTEREVGTLTNIRAAELLLMDLRGEEGPDIPRPPERKLPVQRSVSPLHETTTPSTDLLRGPSCEAM